MPENGEKLQAMQLWAAGAEEALSANFTPWVGALDLGRLVAAEDARVDRFSLVPITSPPEHPAPSVFAIGSYFRLPPDIIINEGPHQKTFLQTACAIGLSYENEVQGIAAGCVVPGGVAVRQIQGTVGPHSAGHYYGRFAWQDPLVRGWIDIAGKLGAQQISILGSKNSQWALDAGFPRLQKELHKAGKPVPKRKTDLTPEQTIEATAKGIAALAKNYDDVADRLRFTEQSDGNWYLDLPARG
ncbi:MAG TPA: hypothetical protein VFB59_05850 [Candidatus Saccharimonadales bacterium]|nr:hypothetical protein [Candidatus Saccharimonadales bacterium]